MKFITLDDRHRDTLTSDINDELYVLWHEIITTGNSKLDKSAIKLREFFLNLLKKWGCCPHLKIIR